MANPIQQGLKQAYEAPVFTSADLAAMANPIQQGLKHYRQWQSNNKLPRPQWLIQYNKD